MGLPKGSASQSPSKYPHPLEITDSSFDGKHLPSTFYQLGTEHEMSLEESDRLYGVIHNRLSILSEFSPEKEPQGVLNARSRRGCNAISRRECCAIAPQHIQIFPLRLEFRLSHAK
jgi:hypothetical protein